MGRRFAISTQWAEDSAPRSRLSFPPYHHPSCAHKSQQVAQAVAAIRSAWEAGVTRQRVELLLPLIGATDLDDWPGGIRQQFKAAAPLVEQILRGLKQVEGLKGPLGAEIWDDGDAVGAWAGDNLAAVLFPTAPTLERLQRLAEERGGRRLVLIVNPQWEVQAGLTSDFGFGDKKRRRLEFVDTFKGALFCCRAAACPEQAAVLLVLRLSLAADLRCTCS